MSDITSVTTANVKSFAVAIPISKECVICCILSRFQKELFFEGFHISHKRNYWVNSFYEGKRVFHPFSETLTKNKYGLGSTYLKPDFLSMGDNLRKKLRLLIATG